jgi:hypothetical protein
MKQNSKLEIALGIAMVLFIAISMGINCSFQNAVEIDTTVDTTPTMHHTISDFTIYDYNVQ